MARAGRKRKDGERWPSGQLKRIVGARIAAEDKERQTVLAQPHRRGNRGQLAASALGRFIEANGLRRELYDAAEAWALDRSKWINTVGGPRLRAVEKIVGTGNDVDMKALNVWRRRDLDGRDAMRRAGGEDGLRGVMRLAADDLELPPHTPTQPIVDALLGLAVAAGKLPARAAPLAPSKPSRPALKATRREDQLGPEDVKPSRPKSGTTHQPKQTESPVAPVSKMNWREERRLAALDALGSPSGKFRAA